MVMLNVVNNINQQHAVTYFCACMQDEQAAVMDRLVCEPKAAELLSSIHIKQVSSGSAERSANHCFVKSLFLLAVIPAPMEGQ